jgi:hypothetical protein
MFVLSNGEVFNAGPDTTTRKVDPTTGVWTTVGTSLIDGMSAVMYRPDKIMKTGSWADPDFRDADVYNTNGCTAVIDVSKPTLAGDQGPSIAVSSSGRPYVLWITPRPQDAVSVAYRTSSGWVSDPLPSDLYAHARLRRAASARDEALLARAAAGARRRPPRPARDDRLVQERVLHKGGLVASEDQGAGTRGSGRIADLGPGIQEWKEHAVLDEGYGTRVSTARTRARRSSTTSGSAR